MDEPVLWYEGAGTSDRRWLLQDRIGSVIGAADAAGAALAAYAYDEYGRPNAWTGARLRYTGQMLLPEAQLYHYRARAYSPTLGRFLQTDPILYAGGMNLYAYVGNDPVNASDASGLACTLVTTNVWREWRDGNGRLVRRELVSSATERIGTMCGAGAGVGHNGPREGGGRDGADEETPPQCPSGPAADLLYRTQEASGVVAAAGLTVGAIGAGTSLFGQPEIGAPMIVLGVGAAEIAGGFGTGATWGLVAIGDRRSAFVSLVSLPLMLDPLIGDPLLAIAADQAQSGAMASWMDEIGIPNCSGRG